MNTENLKQKAASMRERGLKWTTISKNLGCSPQLARAWAKSVDSNFASNLKAKRDKDVLCLKKEGLDVKDVALKMGLSLPTVRKIFETEVKSNYVNPPKFVAYLENLRKVGFSRGKTAQSLHDSGMTWAEVGKVMNATANSVMSIAKRYRAALRDQQQH